MQQMTTRPCPICTYATVDVLHHQLFCLPEAHPLASGYQVVNCLRCGFVYADTMAQQHHYDEYYTTHSKYEDGNTATGGGEAAFDADRLNMTAQCLDGLLGSKSAAIVDIGCANGGLLASLKAIGYTQLTGVDPSPTCANAAKLATGCRTLTGTLTTLSAEQLGTFDCVILSHVLEHVQDVHTAIATLKTLLSPQGLLYLEVPDAERYLDYYVSPFHYFDTEHVNHFSKHSLVQLAHLHGFEVNASGHKEVLVTNDTSYPAVWVAITPSMAPLPRITFDARLRDQIAGYVKRSQQEEHLSDLKQLLGTNEPVIVWGVGCSTTRLLANSPLGSANITAFVDNNPKYWGDTLASVPVISPKDLHGRSEAIVVTSKLYGNEIIRQIRHDQGLTNRIIKAFIEST